MQERDRYLLVLESFLWSVVFLKCPSSANGRLIIAGVNNTVTICFRAGLSNFEEIPLLDSDIIHLNVAGTSIVVLDTLEVANELLDQRSAIYSDRQVVGLYLAFDSPNLKSIDLA